MPRPQKKRLVCCMPGNGCFIPAEKEAADTVIMTVDEYETIRLVDYEEATQEDCSIQMQIARTTVQGIYASARKKLADALVNGKKLVITGGEYRLCGSDAECGTGCRKYCRRCGKRPCADLAQTQPEDVSKEAT